MGDAAGDLKVTWIPRKWQLYLNKRPSNKFDSYGGAGWVLDDMALNSVAPFEDEVFTHLPLGYDVLWILSPGLNQISGTWLVLVDKGGSSYEFGLLSSASYTAITWVPASPLTFAGGLENTSGVVIDGAAYVTTDQGLIKISGGNATLVPGTDTMGLTYIVKHISRLVGVCAASNTIRWSVAGNFDDWTTTVNGAGSSVLILSNDILRGCKVIRNQVVILGFKSIHTAYLTGTANPAYRIEQTLAETDVCTRATSICQHGDELFYVGQVGVYRYDGKQVNIGAGTAAAMLANLGTAVTTNIVGVIAYSMDESQTAMESTVYPRYLILPTYESGADITAYVLAYNIAADVWEAPVDYQFNGSHHRYTYMWVDNYITYEPPKFMDITRSVGVNFNTSGALIRNQVCTLYSPYMLIGESHKNYQLDRIMIKYRSNGAWTYTIQTYCNQDGSRISSGAADIPLGDTDIFPARQWLNCNDYGMVGNNYVFNFDFKNELTKDPFHLEEIEFYFREAGDFRGA